jgi:pimeloyl-ACP methyl ester carboxylesterase
MPNVRRAGFAAALAAAPLALAWRFALVYRHRAGFPKPRPPRATPGIVGLPYEDVTVDAPGTTLPAWFIPACDGAPGPGILLVHGWESSRSRTLPMAQFLHGAGFHVLTVDVRGHGANPAELLPVSAGEFGTDAAAGFDALLARPEVTTGAISGHSMGGIGAILAASLDDRVSAVVMTSSPAGPYRLTRQTFRLARLPLPDPIAYPLAWLTTRVLLRPRGHAVTAVSAGAAIARYDGPIFLAHGDADDIVPLSHFRRLERIVRTARAGRPEAGPVETMVIGEGRHSWLYEFPDYRARVGRFLARALGGPYGPDEAAARAVAVQAVRIPEPEDPISALEDEPGGFRSLVGIVGRPGSADGGSPDNPIPALEA